MHVLQAVASAHFGFSLGRQPGVTRWQRWQAGKIALFSIGHTLTHMVIGWMLNQLLS